MAVAQSRGFTAAAARLGLGQPTVSGHVRRLEAACGRRLFRRDTHSVALTPDGEAMLGFARAVLETEEQARRHFAASTLRGRLRFGASEDLVQHGLPGILREFVRAHPLVDLELTVGLSGTLHGRLEEGALDLVFAKRRASEAAPGGEGAEVPAGESRSQPVWRERLAWIGAPDARPDPAQPLPLILLAPPSITRTMALETLARHGRAWREVCTSSSHSGQRAAALAGLGIGVHARSLIPPGLAELQAPHLPPPGTVEFIVTGGRRALRGPAGALAALIRANSDRLQQPAG
ncbi:LysR family transcriptional regulator [Roseomonas sp. NAR14]|uniref:LysR family transcriptional regulator n=2 Tax=Roseomonas acroporae TaxID=2937791 RepID=A0A9X2BXF7_9PROT|nr:LysR family transcriptional regulator [Roseomonas acroporae]